MIHSQAYESLPAAWLAGMLAGICLALSMAWSTSLAADANDDFRDAMQRLSLRHDFRLWLAPGLPPRSVSADLESLPLDQALERLLRDYSYVTVRGDNGELRELYVLPPGSEPPAALQYQTGDSARALSSVLANDALPDDMKSAILYQALANQAATRQSIRAQREAAIDRLIELVDDSDSAQSASLQLLREKLEAARDRSPGE